MSSALWRMRLPTLAKNRCLCSTRRGATQILGVADVEHIVARIREIAPEDDDVRLSVQFMSASLAGQAGHHAEALCQFQEILQQFAPLLRTSERRDLYEDIQQRRAFSLVHLARYRDAFPILSEAASFSTLQAEDLQEVHLYLGTSYAALNDSRLAKQEFLRATEFDLGGRIEAQARYNLGVIYFQEGGFAQAKHQLEQVLRTHPEEIPNLPHRYIYQQLSWVCGRLGEGENAERYKRLADASTRTKPGVDFDKEAAGEKPATCGPWSAKNLRAKRTGLTNALAQPLPGGQEAVQPRNRTGRLRVRFWTPSQLGAVHGYGLGTRPNRRLHSSIIKLLRIREGLTLSTTLASSTTTASVAKTTERQLHGFARR